MLISVEGQNGAGKSTICKILIEKLSDCEQITNFFNSVKLVKFPCNLNPRHDIYQLIEEQSPRLNEEFALDRYLWFLKNYPNWNNFKEDLIIADRYMASSFAFNSNGTLDNLIKLRDMEFRILGNPVPTHEFIINVQPEVIKERLEKRGNVLRYNERNFDIQKTAYIRYKEYVRFTTNSSIVDNYDLEVAVENIFNQILYLVKGEQND